MLPYLVTDLLSAPEDGAEQLSFELLGVASNEHTAHDVLADLLEGVGGASDEREVHDLLADLFEGVGGISDDREAFGEVAEVLEELRGASDYCRALGKVAGDLEGTSDGEAAPAPASAQGSFKHSVNRIL